MKKSNFRLERRKFVRIHEEDLLVCEPFDVSVLAGASKKRAHVFTKNLSDGGLLFESCCFFEIGTILKIQADIPGWEKYKVEFLKADDVSGSRPLVVLGKVVRIEDVGDGKFDVGVVFAAIDNEHRTALGKYIGNELKKAKETRES